MAYNQGNMTTDVKIRFFAIMIICGNLIGFFLGIAVKRLGFTFEQKILLGAFGILLFLIGFYNVQIGDFVLEKIK